MIASERLTEALMDAKLDGLVVRSPQNTFYLTGRTSVAHEVFDEHLFAVWSCSSTQPLIVMPTRETDRLIGSDIEPEQVYPYGGTNLYRRDTLTAEEQRLVAFQDVRSFDDPIEAVAAVVRNHIDGSRVGVERSALDRSTAGTLEATLSEVDLVDADSLIHDVRRVKTDAEIERIREAAQITESAIETAMASLEPGMTEYDLATTYLEAVASHGAEPVFTTVGFGSHTCYTHPDPGDREVDNGDLIRWDAGIRHEGYVSDIGRTFAYGSATNVQRSIYDALYAGQQATLAEMRDGVVTADPYRAGIETVRDSGVPELTDFDPIHLGHGIGLEVYDPPRIEAADNPIRENMVFCVEPPYNQLGLGGFLIEDEVQVTDDGIERFTTASDQLRIYG